MLLLPRTLRSLRTADLLLQPPAVALLASDRLGRLLQRLRPLPVRVVQRQMRRPPRLPELWPRVQRDLLRRMEERSARLLRSVRSMLRSIHWAARLLQPGA